MRTLAQQLHQARINKQLSQTALAKLAHLTQPMVSKAESGRDIQLSTLLALAKALTLEIVAVTPKQSAVLRQQYSDTPSKQTLLEQFQVKDDD